MGPAGVAGPAARLPGTRSTQAAHQAGHDDVDLECVAADPAGVQVVPEPAARQQGGAGALLQGPPAAGLVPPAKAAARCPPPAPKKKMLPERCLLPTHNAAAPSLPSTPPRHAHVQRRRPKVGELAASTIHAANRSATPTRISAPAGAGGRGAARAGACWSSGSWARAPACAPCRRAEGSSVQGACGLAERLPRRLECARCTRTDDEPLDGLQHAEVAGEFQGVARHRVVHKVGLRGAAGGHA